MNFLGSYSMAIIETGGIFAPLLFIVFHLLRPLFFLPVFFICISGGILFGTVAGTLYSVVGVTLSSVVFYQIIKWMPKTMDRLVRIKEKFVGKNVSFTTSQVALLRLVPFIHFHLLSLCIVEMSSSFKEYTKSSFFSNIPLAVVYTALGKWISNFTPMMILVSLVLLLIFIYLLRKKESSMKWKEFFQVSA